MFTFDYADARYEVDAPLMWCPCCRAPRRVEAETYPTTCGLVTDLECVACGTACTEVCDE